MDKKYTILEALNLIKSQLNTIPVCGHHVQVMSTALSNLDAVIGCFTTAEEEKPNDTTRNN